MKKIKTKTTARSKKKIFQSRPNSKIAHSTSAQQFDRHAKDYDQWFDKNPDVFKAEVNAILSLAPPFENSLEIGVGSGRFAAALGIRHGIDPAPQMLSLARARGIDATIGEAEHLPFTDERYDSAFMITSLYEEPA